MPTSRDDGVAGRSVAGHKRKREENCGTAATGKHEAKSAPVARSPHARGPPAGAACAAVGATPPGVANAVPPTASNWLALRGKLGGRRPAGAPADTSAAASPMTPAAESRSRSSSGHRSEHARASLPILSGAPGQALLAAAGAAFTSAEAVPRVAGVAALTAALQPAHVGASHSSGDASRGRFAGRGRGRGRGGGGSGGGARAQAAATAAATAAALSPSDAAALKRSVLGPLPERPLSSSESKYVGLDCEMVGVGPDGARSVLAQVVLVDFLGRITYL
ncbi:MAG: hypothetical protein EOO41_05260, partial [Methanobacteriota archaeon]